MAKFVVRRSQSLGCKDPEREVSKALNYPVKVSWNGSEHRTPTVCRLSKRILGARGLADSGVELVRRI